LADQKLFNIEFYVNYLNLTIYLNFGQILPNIRISAKISKSCRAIELGLRPTRKKERKNCLIEGGGVLQDLGALFLASAWGKKVLSSQEMARGGEVGGPHKMGC